MKTIFDLKFTSLCLYDENGQDVIELPKTSLKGLIESFAKDNALTPLGDKVTSLNLEEKTLYLKSLSFTVAEMLNLLGEEIDKTCMSVLRVPNSVLKKYISVKFDEQTYQLRKEGVMDYEALKAEILTGVCKVKDKRVWWYPNLEAANEADETIAVETTESQSESED